MNRNGTIITQIGQKQYLFRDRETYPRVMCDCIEDLISCNISEISDEGGNGRIRFLDKEGNLNLQLSLDGANSKLSDKSSSVVLIRMCDGTIKSPVYYGVDCNISFSSKSNVYSLDGLENCVNSLKNFYSSWVVKEGNIGVVIFIVDDCSVFERVAFDDFFKYSYILCSE